MSPSLELKRRQQTRLRVLKVPERREASKRVECDIDGHAGAEREQEAAQQFHFPLDGLWLCAVRTRAGQQKKKTMSRWAQVKERATRAAASCAVAWRTPLARRVQAGIT